MSLEKKKPSYEFQQHSINMIEQPPGVVRTKVHKMKGNRFLVVVSSKNIFPPFISVSQVFSWDAGGCSIDVRAIALCAPLSRWYCSR